MLNPMLRLSVRKQFSPAYKDNRRDRKYLLCRKRATGKYSGGYGKSIFDLLQNKGGQEFVPIKQVAINVLEKIEDAYKTRERLPVSLPDLLIWIINCPVSSLPILS